MKYFPYDNNIFNATECGSFTIAPIGSKSKSLFGDGSCDNISHEEVKKNIIEVISLKI